MSSDTSVSVKSVVWAGGILALLACLHLSSTALLSADHLPGWFRGELWFFPPNLDDLAMLAPNVGAFWMVWGSFGVPLGLVGALVVGYGRRGQVPPSYVGVVVGFWALTSAAVLEPSPFVLGVIPAVMLVVASRKRQAVTA
ncbi:hypothetical protein [Nonomuraea sp. NPDC049400]|uniref:hypothetical protein n=1 Tax=Nonomuraea sp. NPDC049400 TaxID=3364352 RepID=UPI0037ACF4D4